MKSRISDAINIPKDVTMGLPYISVLGNSEAYVENFYGILEYNSDYIRIQTKLGRIHIIGSDLKIDYFSKDEMKIIGVISNIEYLLGGINC